jgi:hypothetical protein
MLRYLSGGRAAKKNDFRCTYSTSVEMLPPGRRLPQQHLGMSPHDCARIVVGPNRAIMCGLYFWYRPIRLSADKLVYEES